MTGKILLPDVPDEVNGILGQLLDRLDKRAAHNQLRSDLYDNERRIRQVSHVVPPHYNNLRLVLGWSTKAIDSLVRRCNLDGFAWPDGSLDDLGFREVWDGNMLASEVDQSLTSSAIHGPAFAVTTRGGDREPPALIHFKDASNATGEWNPRTRRLDNLLSIIARDKHGAPSSLALYLDGETYTAERDGNVWEVDHTEHPWGVPAEVLPYRPRLGRPFGASRISKPIISLQDQAVRTLIRLEGHLDVFSFPEMWMLGADESIFKNADGSQKAAWEIMLGRTKGIPDDEDAANPRADVKQFPASSPEPHLAALNAFAKMFAREASLPDSAVAITDVANPTSAESYDASQYELIAEAEGAVDDWTPGLRRTMVRALAMANDLDEVPDEWLSIDAKWRDPRYLSRSAMADAGMKILTAAPELASTEVGYELLGLDERQIKIVLADQRRREGTDIVERLTAARDTGAEDASVIKAKADALGALIRAGVSGESAARQLGLEGLDFTGAVPVSLRMPADEADQLEQQ